jgi:hypothetical protein
MIFGFKYHYYPIFLEEPRKNIEILNHKNRVDVSAEFLTEHFHNRNLKGTVSQKQNT